MANRLVNEESLYLKQHATNPVHWWPYGPEALLKSQEENKPIFLSVGYSSCHWCHVMEHESFEDEQTAQYLNENFICIKVDREEFPDIDYFYQQCCMALNRSGGWPLSAFLLPDLKPFFVGTYFPKNPRAGMPTFMELITDIKKAFYEQPNEIKKRAQEIYDVVNSEPQEKEKIRYEGFFPPPNAILKIHEQFADNDFGGYGQAPKFPMLALYEWAIEHMAEGIIEDSIGKHIIKTMDGIFMGGIYDQAKGGLHRYSTDESWTIPHFEKMLYDQSGALKTLSKLSLIYPAPLIFDNIIQTLEYLESEMLREGGHFFSAQDADSEGVEGLYFTFKEEEFEEALLDLADEEIEEKMDQIKKWFRITKEGNFERGLNAITIDSEYKEEIFEPKNWDVIRKVRRAIVEARKLRIPPATDNKGVASWNFMLISALVDVFQYTKIEVIKSRAMNLLNKTMQNVFDTFVIKDALNINNERQTLIKHSTTKDLSLPYFEDYAMFAESQLRLYEITSNENFKENLKGALDYIFNEFFINGKFYTRAKTYNDHAQYPNLEVQVFDQSFKSPLGVIISVVRRSALVFKSRIYLEKIEPIFDETIQMTLANPLGAGECLRALTYPPQAYRSLEVSKKWLNNSKFLDFISRLMPRFVLTYHCREDEKWQICTENACEFVGNNLDELVNILQSKGNENES